jgi:transketolase
LGEDGPTHQPVEQLTALRCIPNLVVLRPADATETAEAWRVAIEHKTGPVALVLTRQKLPLIDRAKCTAAAHVAHGAYVLSNTLDGTVARTIILATGSEVPIALAAQQMLAADGIATRVVSAPSLELFAQETQKYRDAVLPKGVPRVAIEAAHPMSWYRWVGDHGVVIGIETFGASAPAPRLYVEYGITATRVVDTVRALLG